MSPGTSTDLTKPFTFVEGDYWRGVPSILITVGGVIPSDDVASCLFVVKAKTETGDRLVTLTNGSGITITSANGWDIKINQQVINLKAGEYVWTLKITDATGFAMTYLKGPMIVETSL